MKQQTAFRWLGAIALSFFFISVGLYLGSTHFALTRSLSVSTDSDGKTESLQNDVQALKHGLKSVQQSNTIMQQELSSLNRQVNEVLEKLTQVSDQNLARSNETSIEKQVLTGSDDDLEPTPEDLADELNSAVLESANVMENYKEAVATQFHSETVDTDWAWETENWLHDSFQQNDELQGLTLVDARCASTLCNAIVRLDDSIPEHDAASLISRHRPWKGHTIMKRVGGELQIFFARDEHALPAF